MDETIFDACAAEFLRSGQRSLAKEVYRRLAKIEELLAAGAKLEDIRAMLRQAGVDSTHFGFRSALARARRRARATKTLLQPGIEAAAPPHRTTPAPPGYVGIRPADGVVPPGPAQLDAALRNRPTLADLDKW